MNFTDEAKALWDKLSEEDKEAWTRAEKCQNCLAPISPDDFNVSVYEGQLAFFHHCPYCQNKEVRLLEVNETRQEEIDEDFNRWLDSKKKGQS